MREESARRVLLVQAIEEADRDGRLLAPQERLQATAAARASAGDATAVLDERAARLLDIVTPRAAWIPPALRATQFPSTLAWMVPLVAAAAGLLTDALGPDRRVNILSIPLLGLIVWNLGVYLALLVLGVAATVRRPGRGAPGLAEHDGGWDRLMTAWTDWRLVRRARARAEGSGIARDAVTAYLARWRRLAAPLFVLRLRGVLHAGAALLAIGVLVGAYGRGLAFEYQATWESTFLDAHALRAVLLALLGPASALLGDPIPPAETLAALRAPGAGDAAPWIHRYALTTLLVVVGPRAILTATALARAGRLAADLPVDLRAPYFLRLQAGRRPPARVEVLPYGIGLDPHAEARLRRLLHDLVGAAADVHVAPSAPYGTEPDQALSVAGPAADTSEGETWRAIVFGLGQSPEDEVHGAMLRGLAAWVTADGRGHRRALAVVDGGPYRARLAGTGVEDRRLADRRRAWDRVAHDAGATLVHLDLHDPAGEDPALASLERGVWPVRAGT